ncbi:MAG: hypothetical protein AAGD43_02310 [Pseudomonadota bacterium]
MQPVARKRPPNRRLTETRKVSVPRGQTVYLSVGYSPDRPDHPIEVFYSAGLKSGSDLEYHMQDMCVLISQLLQRGATPADIAHSLSQRETETGDMAYASLVGWVVSEIAKPPAWAEGQGAPS